MVELSFKMRSLSGLCTFTHSFLYSFRSIYGTYAAYYAFSLVLKILIKLTLIQFLAHNEHSILC